MNLVGNARDAVAGSGTIVIRTCDRHRDGQHFVVLEVADDVQRVQVEVLCWCGAPGLLNARVVDGVMVRAGETVVVADTAPAELPGEEPAVRYQVLCRRHHVRGQLGPTAAGPGQLALP